jgi:hypothetical protein
MSDEPTPEGPPPGTAPTTDQPATGELGTDEPAPVEPTTDEVETDEALSDKPATHEPAAHEPVTALVKAPPPRSIARDVALMAVVFVAVFILLGGLLSLAARPGDRGVTRPSTSSVPSAADPTPVASAPGSRSVPADGTGDAALRSLPNPAANSERRDNADHGVIKIALHPTSYDWTLLRTTGGSADPGNGVGH